MTYLPSLLKRAACFMAASSMLMTACKKETIDPVTIPPTTNPIATTATVTSIAPTTGVAGTEVTITGTNFSTTTTDNLVKFNGSDAVVKSATATKLIVTAPASTTGAITVKVKNVDASGSPTFTYGLYPVITSITPNTAKPGDRVTVAGSNFSSVISENRVNFVTGGTASAQAVIVSATASQLVVEVPAAAVSGNVVVNTNGFQSNLMTITVTPVSQGSDVSLFAPQSSNQPERFVVDSRSNVYVYYNMGEFKVAGADGVVKKTFTKADFNNHTGNIMALGKDLNGNACVAWNRYVGSRSYTSFFRIKADFTTELIGSEVAPSLSSITPTRPFVVDAKGDVYYTDNYSVYKVENSTIDLTKRYLDGRNYPATPYYWDLQIDTQGNLYVLTSTQLSASENNQSIIKYDANKNATTIYTVKTATIALTTGSVAATTIGEFKAFVRTTEGDIYVGDYSGNRIRKVIGNNTTEVVAGSGEYYRNATGTNILTGPKMSTPIPRPLYMEYDATKKLIYTSPYTYSGGGFIQAFAL